MAIQKHFVNTNIANTFSHAPARTISRKTVSREVETVIDQVIVLISKKQDERQLPHALNIARENNAELLVVYMSTPENNSPQMSQNTKLYTKSLRNKLKAQYHNVTLTLYQSNNIIALLSWVINDKKQTCVVLPAQKTSWLPRLLQGDISSKLARNHDNLTFRKV